MADRKLHWRTERIVEEADKYVHDMTGNSCIDFLYYEYGVEAEDSVKSRYTTWDDEKECWIDWWDVDIDECFTEEDWKDVENAIYIGAENMIDFFARIDEAI